MEPTQAKTARHDEEAPPIAGTLGQLVAAGRSSSTPVPVAVVVSIFDDLLAGDADPPGARDPDLDDVLIDRAGVARLDVAADLGSIGRLLTETLDPEVPSTARGLLDRLQSEEPADRPSDAEQLRAWLRDALGQPADRGEVVALMTSVSAPLPIPDAVSDPGETHETDTDADGLVGAEGEAAADVPAADAMAVTDVAPARDEATEALSALDAETVDGASNGATGDAAVEDDTDEDGTEAVTDAPTARPGPEPAEASEASVADEGTAEPSEASEEPVADERTAEVSEASVAGTSTAEPSEASEESVADASAADAEPVAALGVADAPEESAAAASLADAEELVADANAPVAVASAVDAGEAVAAAHAADVQASVSAADADDIREDEVARDGADVLDEIEAAAGAAETPTTEAAETPTTEAAEALTTEAPELAADPTADALTTKAVAAETTEEMPTEAPGGAAEEDVGGEAEAMAEPFADEAAKASAPGTAEPIAGGAPAIEAAEAVDTEPEGLQPPLVDDDDTEEADADEDESVHDLETIPPTGALMAPLIEAAKAAQARATEAEIPTDQIRKRGAMLAPFPFEAPPPETLDVEPVGERADPAESADASHPSAADAMGLRDEDDATVHEGDNEGATLTMPAPVRQPIPTPTVDAPPPEAEPPRRGIRPSEKPPIRNTETARHRPVVRHQVKRDRTISVPVAPAARRNVRRTTQRDSIVGPADRGVPWGWLVLVGMVAAASYYLLFT